MVEPNQMTLSQYHALVKAQWAGEEGKPFPKIPQEIINECRARYLWQIRNNPDKERLRKTAYGN